MAAVAVDVIPKGWGTNPSAPPASAIPKLHAHGCITCGNRYMDACSNKLENDTCTPCRTGAEPVLWDAARFPQDCCKKPGACRMMVGDEIARYALGGNSVWYQCRVCFRTHPFKNPSGGTS